MYEGISLDHLKIVESALGSVIYFNNHDMFETANEKAAEALGIVKSMRMIIEAQIPKEKVGM